VNTFYANISENILFVTRCFLYMYKNCVSTEGKLASTGAYTVHGNQIVLWAGLTVIVAFLVYETFIAKPRSTKSKDDK